MPRLSLFPTPIGDCGIAWESGTVVATTLPDETSDATAARLAARTGAVSGDPPDDIRRAIRSIIALLEGIDANLSHIACDMNGIEPFAQKVYAATRAVPAGQTLTYGDIARQIGNVQLARTVGQTLGRNPFPIIIPCHRIVGAHGRLTGFSAPGGTRTKLKLLAIEEAAFGGASGLFDHLPIAVKP
ncbi:hypothetical protein A8B75_11190 [Sphingomonadales bacterium EhC05]|nr:hypothetical protein A8B75_11190 [Sphingomonadales bacterium EhC05]